MGKDEFKQMYLERMLNSWNEYHNIPSIYAILMTDGGHTDFGINITAEKSVRISNAVNSCCRACREAVFGGVIDGKKYTKNDLACTVFMTEVWVSKSAETTGVRPSKSSDKETAIIFQFIDINEKESTVYRCVDGELIIEDKTVNYNKNTN